MIRFHILSVLTAFAALASQALAQQRPIRGFSADAVATQARRETELRAIPRADTLRTHMRILSEEPHEAGTDRSKRIAETILATFRSYGLDARIEQFEALMPRPVSRTLELLSPEKFRASLAESTLPEDKDSGDRNQLPTYNAFSPDGDVTAQLVYVNYGIPEDYRVLDSIGVSVKGKIVIARYGRSWRGIKPKLAAEHGAVGCIIYSDPRDDGYFEGDVYPKGPMRPSQGVQRGSVMDMPTYPGDPLSPGWASEPGARKLAISDVKTIEPIPVLPISYGDALPLLRNLGGPVAPEKWRGALPITYHVGPGPAEVHLALKFDWQTRPLYNVIARVNGAQSPDQWIIAGNHHDAWVNGANDPISGMVALQEAARAVGALLKTGWRPARTLIFAAWDGEEWGLLGSTEWVEKHRDALRKSTVLYLNGDTNGRGWIGGSGSHSLEAFITQLARDIPHPASSKSALEASVERKKSRADSASADTTFTIDALGSGSDYTAFIDHAGVPSAHVSYGGLDDDGFYHSIYDSFDSYTRFSDTSFAFGVAQAQTIGTALLRLADAPVLPFEFTAVARTYRKYVEEIEKAARKNDTTKALDLSPVKKSLDRLQQAAEKYEKAFAAVETASSSKLRSRWKQLAAVNTALYQTEQALTDDKGLDGRAWYKHLIYAPGFYTGYGVKTMPGIREAVEDRPSLQVAQREAARVAAALDRYATQVERAATDLTNALK
ncbi:MAG: transferrin receptor-like dimerization domain-containing protein [Gemmatimonadaceae bacterium]